MKFKSSSDVNLPLSKPLKFHAMTLVIRSLFEKGGALYPPVFLDDAWHEL